MMGKIRIAILILIAGVMLNSARAATLTGALTNTEATINLTAQGPHDWTHWGLEATNLFNHKMAVLSRITNVVLLGTDPVSYITNTPVQFSWTNGVPTETATTSNYLAIAGTDAGFELNVAADTTVRQLTVHFGFIGTQASIEATLSDGSTTPFNTILTTDSATNLACVLNYAASSAGQILRLRVAAVSPFQPDSAMLLGAATLVRVGSNLPPVVSITSPTNDANLITGDITLSALATDADGAISRVEFFSGTNKLGEATSAPYSFLWTNAPLGTHLLTARARDDEGTNSTSAITTAFVVTTGGLVTLGFLAPTGTVNLTAEGVADWVHWGLVTENTVNRKAGVAPLISNFSIVGFGPQYQFFDNFNGYTWTDGTPRAGITNTATGVYIFGVGNGFEIQAPATNVFRTLRVHVGAYAGRGKLRALVTDYSASVVNDASVSNVGNGPGGIYTITYRAASPGQKLVMRYTLANHYAGDGNITLQAASLLSDNNPPAVTLLSPTNNSIVTVGTNVVLLAAASDGDGTVSFVEFYRDATLVGVVSNAPYTVTLTNIAAGNYAITARAVDIGGAFADSTPAQLFAVTGAGYLRGSMTNPPSSVNLSAEGHLDWAHWGLTTIASVNRRADITPVISGVTKLGSGPTQRYANNFSGFTWTNGTPTANVVGTHTGLFMIGISNGFRITIPADTLPKRLSVYAGVYGARGRFEATLSDHGAAPFINNELERVFSDGSAIYSVDFAAGTNNQTLTVRYTAEALNDLDFGNVTWQAATLTPIPPTITVHNPSLNGNVFSGQFFAYPGVSYTVERSDAFGPASWETLTNIMGGASNAWFFDTPPPTRFYRVKLN
jgi:hypothetical protein